MLVLIPEGIRWVPIRYHHRLFLLKKKACMHAKTLNPKPYTFTCGIYPSPYLPKRGGRG
jgi:hypothetical protein